MNDSKIPAFASSRQYQQIIAGSLYYRNITPILNKTFITKVIEPGVRANTHLSCSIMYELASQIVNYVMAKPYTIVNGRPDASNIIPMKELNRVATDLIVCGYAVMGVSDGKIIRVPPECVDPRNNEWVGYDYFADERPDDFYPLTANIPVSRFKQPEYYTSLKLDFPCLIERTKQLIDAYELLYSRKNDALTDAPNAPLIIKGYLDNPDEIVNRAREDGAICIASDGEVEALKCDVDFSQQDTQLDRLLYSIYRAAECVPPLHNSGADTSSVTLKMMYVALDSTAHKLEDYILPALSDCLNSASFPGYSSSELQQIQIAFNYSGVINENDDITNAVQLVNILSREALVEHIPWIKNVEEELKRPPCAASTTDILSRLQAVGDISPITSASIDDEHQSNNRYDSRKKIAANQ